MATIILKGKFDCETVKNCTVVLDDYAEENFIGLKIDDTKRQVIVKLHQSELEQIIKASQQQVKVEPEVMQKIAEEEHECKYCGCMTTQPDEQCYRAK